VWGIAAALTSGLTITPHLAWAETANKTTKISPVHRAAKNVGKVRGCLSDSHMDDWDDWENWDAWEVRGILTDCERRDRRKGSQKCRKKHCKVCCKGERGPEGPQGETGSQGLQGETGPQGVAGPEGGTGPQGSTGPQGGTGPQGSTGPQGGTGPQGLQGVTGPQGGTGPQGETGPAGSTSGISTALVGTGGNTRKLIGLAQSGTLMIRDPLTSPVWHTIPAPFAVSGVALTPLGNNQVHITVRDNTTPNAQVAQTTCTISGIPNWPLNCPGPLVPTYSIYTFPA
jgi:hypothetical protein